MWSESLMLSTETQLNSLSSLRTTQSEVAQLRRHSDCQPDVRRSLFSRSMMMAASILLAFTLGWLVDRSLLSRVTKPVAPEGRATSEAASLSTEQVASTVDHGKARLVWATRVLPADSDLPGARIQIPLDPDRVQSSESELSFRTIRNKRWHGAA